MTETLAQYPVTFPVLDWPEYVVGLLPDVAATTPGGEYFGILVQPLGVIDDAIAMLYAGMADLGDAAGVTVDVLGDWVNEPRKGLIDSEYRRIVGGRRAALPGAVTPARVFAGWVALTTPQSATLTELAPASTLLIALVDYVPTDSWLSRAGAVAADLVGAGYGVDAIVATDGTAVFDASPGFDLGTFAYDLRT